MSACDRMSGTDWKTIVIIVAVVGVSLVVGYGLSLQQASGAEHGAASDGIGVGMSGNGTTLSMTRGTVFTVRLDENPTTGYSWNATTTAGLTVINSTYVSGGSLMGAGGVREWKLQATGTGSQEFNATYERPWEKFGNETQYHLIINVA